MSLNNLGRGLKWTLFRNARRGGIQKTGDINESGLPSAKGFKLNNLMGSVMDPTQECKEAAWDRRSLEERGVRVSHGQ